MIKKNELRGIEISSQNAENFVNDLWENMRSTGVYSLSQKNIYDYLLYLFNKYDEKHFFDNNTNEQNERLLKITASKIKSAKKNISVQFMQDDEYKKLFGEFLRKIKDNKIKLSFRNNKLKLTLENPSIKSVLEAKLKDMGESFEYTLNNESVEIGLDIFLEMLEKESKSDFLDNDLKNFLKEIIEKIKKELNIKDLGEYAQAISNMPRDYGFLLIKKIISKFKETKI